MGTLHRQPSGKGEVLSFKYAGSWLDKSDAFMRPTRTSRSMTGISIHQREARTLASLETPPPDRWGQVLMQRWENLVARKEGIHSRRLMEWDFLLGACDDIRLSALRFMFPGGPYLSSPDGIREAARSITARVATCEPTV